MLPRHLAPQGCVGIVTFQMRSNASMKYAALFVILLYSQYSYGQGGQKEEPPSPRVNSTLAAQLDTILKADQEKRLLIETVEKKYGFNSKEMDALWQQIQFQDSLNLSQVERIINQYGWLGPEEVGENGSTAIFLVIQHADLSVQEKYLPLMRKAVSEKKALPKRLALLEDRVAIRQGRKQRYGSQLAQNPETGIYYVSSLEDPDNVDKRRASVGLDSMAQNLKRFNMTWDVEQYKKDLPAIMKFEGIE
jgi:hypothetical protein